MMLSVIRSMRVSVSESQTNPAVNVTIGRTPPNRSESHFAPGERSNQLRGFSMLLIRKFLRCGKNVFNTVARRTGRKQLRSSPCPPCLRREFFWLRLYLDQVAV